MTDDRFDDLVRDAAREYHAPPTPPREEMWAEIEAARAGVRWRAGRYRGSLGWALGIAAALLVGVGLGRLAPPPGAPAALPIAATTVPSLTPVTGTAYRVVAAEHFGQAQVLLASFRDAAETGQMDAAVADWARDLLSTTRLMLDSPAAVDPETRLLLEDLELLLAQIAHLPRTTTSAADRQEVRLVTAAIDEGDVLPKLRSATRDGSPLTSMEE